MLLFNLLILLLFYWRDVCAAPVDCKNGGQNDLKNETICNCPDYWKGNDCSEIICLNGGYLQENVCVCPTGYLGVHCDATTQIRPPISTFAPSQQNINIIVYNLFSDYFGFLHYQLFREALKNHISEYPDYYKDGKHNIYTNDNVANSTFHCTDESCDITIEPHDDLPEKANYPQLYSCYSIPIYKDIINMITLSQLRETSITILTQHPPTNCSENSEQLINLALAFRIRINILFSEDKTFIRCSEDQYEPLRKLSQLTNGIFTRIPEDKDNQTISTLMNMILKSNVAYEPIDFITNQSSLNFTADPLLNTYFIIVNNNVRVEKSQCPNYTHVETLDFNIYSFSALIIRCYMEFTNSTNIQIYAAGKKNFAQIYYSFVEDPIVDTSNVVLVNGVQYYFAMRVQNLANEIIKYELSETHFINGAQETQINRNKTRSDYVLPLISETISCTSNNVNTWGIRITFNAIQADQSSTPMRRYIPLQCLSSSINSKLIDSEKADSILDNESQRNVIYTLDSFNTIKQDHILPITATQESPIANNMRSFILGYSNTISNKIYSQFIVTSTNWSNCGAYSNFGEILFQTTDNLNYTFPNDYTTFTSTVYNEFGQNKDKEKIKSQILDAVEIIKNSTKIPEQNSLITFITDVLPESSTTINTEEFKTFVNRNNKLLFLFDSNWFNREVEYFQRSTDILNTLAAITNGHLIISDHSDIESLKKTLENLYQKGPGKNLLFSKNFISSRDFYTTLGQIDLKNKINSTSLFLTSTIAVKNITGLIKSTVNVKFIGENKTYTSELEYLNNSNYYYSLQNLLPDIYTIQVSVLTRGQLPVHLRFWTSETSVEIQTQYVDYSDEKTDPDNFLGAALRASLPGDSDDSLHVTFQDCRPNTLQTSYFNAKQVVNKVDELYRFVPLFCQERASTEGCVTGTENIYHMQIHTKSGNFHGSRSFYCSKSKEVKQCQYVDNNGNYFCNQQQSPYLRGPGGKVIDCINNGNLVYSINQDPNLAPYKCNCTTDEGLSCEKSTCELNANQEPIDMYPRTYTVVAGRLDSSLPNFINGIKTLIKYENITNIWQYQFIYYCSSDTYLIIYLGGDKKKFINALSQDATSYCDEGANNFNLNNIYAAGLKALGKKNQGVFVFYYEPSYILQNLIVNLTEFYQVAQQYNQKLFIYGGSARTKGVIDDIGSSILSAAMSTGGTVIGETNDNEFFTNLLSNPTSLNYHKQADINSPLTQVSVYVEDKAYLVIDNTENIPLDKLNWTCSSGATLICEISEKTYINLPTKAMWASVFIINTKSSSIPYAVLRNMKDSDRNDAVSLDDKDSRTIIGLQLPETYKLIGNSANYSRIIQRRNCTFNYITYLPLNPLAYGTNIIEISLKINDGDIVNKVLPIITTTKIHCQNGGTPSFSGACDCTTTEYPNHFTGFDCSEVICEKPYSKKSTWGQACNCGSTAGGRFCSPSKMESFSYYQG